MSIISGMTDEQTLKIARSPGGAAALEKHLQAILLDSITSAPVSASAAKRGRKPSVKPAIESPPTAVKPKRGMRKTRPLADGQPTASTKPRKASGAKAGKRDPGAIEALTGSFVDYVKAHPGETKEEIGNGLNEATGGLALPAKKAIAAGLVHTKGNKRATRYFHVSAAA